MRIRADLVTVARRGERGLAASCLGNHFRWELGLVEAYSDDATGWEGGHHVIDEVVGGAVERHPFPIGEDAYRLHVHIRRGFGVILFIRFQANEEHFVCRPNFSNRVCLRELYTDEKCLARE